MADRGRRMRRQISDTPDDPSEPSASESEDYDPRKADSARRAGKNEIISPNTGRSRRTVGDDSKQSIRLTMKVAPSKLREVMRANEVDSLQDTLGGGQVIDGPRSRRAAAANARSSGRGASRPTYAEYGESDIEEDEEDEEDDDDDEEDAEAEEDDANDFDELGAEAEGGTEEEDEGGDDDDEDVEMEDAPPTPLPPPPPTYKNKQAQPKAPKITLKAPSKAEAKQGSKPKVIVTPANVGPLKPVEDQEMDDDPGDEEVEESSELSDNEDATNLNEEEDVEGEEEEEIEEEDVEIEEDEADEDDDLDDSDADTPASGAATPDPAKMTKRQRAIDGGGLMALDMAPQQRKFFTDEEKAMKKDEHARKRKELTKRKIYEEKTAALNRLLKPQASKARGAAPKPETLAAATAAAAEGGEDMVERADPLYTRWISTKDGIRLGVPEEWLGKHVGRTFGPPLPVRNGSLVQEVE